MKKNLMIVATAVAAMICSGVSAAPLTDYSAGKSAIDLNFRNSDADSTGHSFGKKNGLDWGITTGLGKNFAIQYNAYNAKSKDISVFDPGLAVYNTINIELKNQEFNVLYQIDKNVSVYTGIIKTKGISSFNGSNTSTNEKSAMQFGLIGSAKIADKTTVYGLFAVASDFTNWKIGVSQEIAPNLDLNVDYRRIQVKNLSGNYAGTNDVTTKGLGYGVTYRF